VSSEILVEEKDRMVGGRRRCGLTGESASRAGLVRFVVGPDGRVVPDVAERLPGRGVWLKADRDVIRKAVAKQTFARAVRSAAVADPALADETEILVRRQCLETMGLARRAGALVVGYDQVADLLRRGSAAVVVMAADAAEGQAGRLRGLAGDLPVVRSLGRAEIGQAVGRADATYAALAPGGLADRLERDAGRLAGLGIGGAGTVTSHVDVRRDKVGP
jgi:predicted RNA-binding protein YlxR (DUF448 family)